MSTVRFKWSKTALPATAVPPTRLHRKILQVTLTLVAWASELISSTCPVADSVNQWPAANATSCRPRSRVQVISIWLRPPQRMSLSVVQPPPTGKILNGIAVPPPVAAVGATGHRIRSIHHPVGLARRGYSVATRATGCRQRHRIRRMPSAEIVTAMSTRSAISSTARCTLTATSTFSINVNWPARTSRREVPSVVLVQCAEASLSGQRPFSIAK